MDIRKFGAIDCDIHPAVPNMKALLPYLDDYWRETVIQRGIDRENFDLNGFPPTTDLACRPDWRPPQGDPGTDIPLLQKQALDHFGSRAAICNVLHAAQALFNQDLAAAMCRAINDWSAKELLDRDPRLLGSIVIPWQDIDLTIKEIERVAKDKRFVQIMMWAMSDVPIGERKFWPIYEIAQHYGLTIGVHAGSTYRHSPTPVGWGQYLLADYIAFGNGFDNALLSLIVQGVFVKFPKLKVALLESGVTWLPYFMWRANKAWRGVRAETPWVKHLPSEYVYEHARATLNPVDAPPDGKQLALMQEQIGLNKLLLFSTDYPHWQFDGDNAYPDVLADFAQQILVDNAYDTYPRLKAAMLTGQRETAR